MKNWLISIISVAILLILLELLLAEGTTKKYITGILHLIIVIAIISPIINLLKTDNFDISKELNDFFSIEQQSGEDFYERTSSLNIAITEQKIKTHLTSSNISCNVKITTENTEIISIKIYVNENGINEEHTNIYTNEKIIQIVQNVVNVEKDRIIIYDENTK